MSSTESESETDSEATEDPELLKERLAEENTYELINEAVPELEGLWEPPLEMKRTIEEGRPKKSD